MFREVVHEADLFTAHAAKERRDLIPRFRTAGRVFVWDCGGHGGYPLDVGTMLSTMTTDGWYISM